MPPSPSDILRSLPEPTPGEWQAIKNAASLQPRQLTEIYKPPETGNPFGGQPLQFPRPIDMRNPYPPTPPRPIDTHNPYGGPPVHVNVPPIHNQNPRPIDTHNPYQLVDEQTGETIEEGDQVQRAAVQIIAMRLNLLGGAEGELLSWDQLSRATPPTAPQWRAFVDSVQATGIVPGEPDPNTGKPTNQGSEDRAALLAVLKRLGLA